MLVSGAWGQIRLLIGTIDFEASRRYFPAGAAIGIWLVMVNLSLLTSSEFPSALSWIGLASGLGYLLTVAGFLKGASRIRFSTGADC